MHPKALSKLVHLKCNIKSFIKRNHNKNYFQSELFALFIEIVKIFGNVKYLPENRIFPQQTT